MWVAFALQKLLTFFSAKKFSVSLNLNFNESLTNDIVSFEQLDPVWKNYMPWIDDESHKTVTFCQILWSIFNCMYFKTIVQSDLQVHAKFWKPKKTFSI